ncbi:hypothetical protein ABZ470_19975 [Streptosporangium sp. NPDC020072]|uniref:Integral membrane protein n=1 Tax=Streptosporangium jomthongense TaxID=1193683 RepID=A0ABV8F5R3_9ACTN
MPVSPLRTAKFLVVAYAVLSVLTVAAIAVLSSVAPSLVTPQAWVRGVIVAATSVLTFVFARRAQQGGGRALLRLRIVLVVILVALGGVVLFLALPAWMVVEQAVCGVLLLVAAVLAFRASPVPANGP